MENRLNGLSLVRGRGVSRQPVKGVGRRSEQPAGCGGGGNKSCEARTCLPPPTLTKQAPQLFPDSRRTLFRDSDEAGVRARPQRIRCWPIGFLRDRVDAGSHAGVPARTGSASDRFILSSMRIDPEDTIAGKPAILRPQLFADPAGPALVGLGGAGGSGLPGAGNLGSGSTI
jgi:hypothetical protein